MYKVVQIWPGLFVCKSGDISPGHIWTTLYIYIKSTVAINVMLQLYLWRDLYKLYIAQDQQHPPPKWTRFLVCTCVCVYVIV